MGITLGDPPNRTCNAPRRNPTAFIWYWEASHLSSGAVPSCSSRRTPRPLICAPRRRLTGLSNFTPTNERKIVECNQEQLPDQIGSSRLSSRARRPWQQIEPPQQAQRHGVDDAAAVSPGLNIIGLGLFASLKSRVLRQWYSTLA